MGVHGLTTYLRENSRTLSKSITFPTPSGNVVSIVVDGWSFIYNLYQDSKLPWVCGGEYPEFSKLIIETVEAWIRLGLKIYFVFDGACPDLKFPTMVNRLGQSHVQPALLFFRTSSTSRSTPRFLNETRILPPLSYPTCTRILEELAQKHAALEVLYADEEGDPYSVELAGRVGGYVVGNDSDFVILNARGYLGYIPLDDMVWESVVPDQSPLVDNDPGDDFQQVNKNKSRKKREIKAGRGILPPEGAQSLRLSCSVYHPDVLAAHLKLPVTLLPLLGALVGNDFTSHTETDRRSIQSQFFNRRLSIIQRIETAAAAMRSILSPTTPRKKNKHQVGSVMDLIDRTVNLLLSRLVTPPPSGEVDAVIDKVVTATLQYAITKHEGDNSLWANDICALHDPDLCPLLPSMSRRVVEESDELDGQSPAFLQCAAIRDRYVQAYRRGEFSPKLMDALNTGTSWPRLFLETPDLETVPRSITSPLRVWIYSILDDSLGLPIAEQDAVEVASVAEISTRKDEAAIGNNDGGAEDELIDVVEVDSEEEKVDFLAPLKGELQRLHISDDDSATDAPASAVSQRSNRVGTPTITEYLRRGTRIASEIIPVPPLHELLSSLSLAVPDDPDEDDIISLAQKSPEDRFTVFLRILDSDLPSVRRLPSDLLQPVLAVRWIVSRLHQRAVETGSSDKEKEKWTTHEAKCFLAAVLSWPDLPRATNDFPPIQDRNVQLSAQLLATLDSINHLAQALLLTKLIPPVSHRLSFKLLHCYLSRHLSFTYDIIGAEVWDACRDGLVEAYREDRGKKQKNTQKNAGTTPAPRQKLLKKNTGTLSAFSLLAELDA
ncbi:hypothetical protein AGABI2DRAFT_204844 [Agaricus bisporus var. bisporus H97]|uniref:hypothetical protein n=1 Tax=Agaricus bisporus var. bisporus (strain H97 / ATCC MYA-4626 / FGSC 10389) TaxID=936046 RepID=UPI00029F5832|nr:hypothetical protein AGABI2DRAFT_204844 [Agaricus bisporus var. bisporus H97]EKV47572.1 hypothetical protein AGABI2DRAFT_204844 [Agaricus bisporus var. bisporus H97]